jgi:hypothetical protein
MKYCPECADEFQDSVSRCAECGCELISEKKWRELQARRIAESNEVFVRIATAGDRFEADVIKDALSTEGIPVLVRTFQDTSFDGLYVSQKGWAVIEVPETFLDRARFVIDAFAASRPES